MVVLISIYFPFHTHTHTHIYHTQTMNNEIDEVELLTAA